MRVGRDAIVIGIDSYPGQPLYGCVNDANEISSYLSLEQYGFDTRKLLNAKASRSNILEELARLAYRDDEREMLVVYFAGHGAAVGGVGHLVAHDSSGHDPGISLSHLAQLMESASAHYQHVIAILDCCHSGGATTWVNARPLVAADIDRDLVSVNASRCVLAACRPEESSHEADGAGYFTTALLAGMSGDAVDYSGNVTLFGLHDYVAQAIPSDIQVPVFKGDVAGTVVVGSGFPKRVGAPIPDVDKQTVLSKGHALLDGYVQTELREYHDQARRRRGGSSTCATALQSIFIWFEETQSAMKQLVAEPAWVEMKRRLSDHRRNLAELSVGEQTRFGEIKRLIGGGGYGHVWEIEDGSRRVAYKVYHGNELQDRVKVQRFKNGFDNMRQLEHPRIVRVHELTMAPLGFTMDAIPGFNLRDLYLDRDDARVALRLIVEIAETVAHAHDRGVLHRDIKPENIVTVLGEDGVPVPYLTDFDLAYHETNRTVTTNLGVGGVINYAAPEQLYDPHAGAAREATVDVYSLAQLLFYVMTGADPAGDDRTGNIETLRALLRDWVEDRAARIILDTYTSATQKSPGDRPQTVRELISELSKAEAYALEASGNGDVTEEDFCRRVATMYAGFDRFEAGDFRASFMSVSEGVAVEVRTRGVARGDRVDIEVELNVRGKLPVPSFKSGTDARAAVNARLDKMLNRFGAKRRPGNSGQYQVFVEASQIGLNVEGVSKVTDLIRAAIGGIEQW